MTQNKQDEKLTAAKLDIYAGKIARFPEWESIPTDKPILVALIAQARAAIDLQRQLAEKDAEIERLTKENNYLRVFAQKAGCPYNNLNENGGCRSGYPGCACADDLMVFDEQHSKVLKQRADDAEAKLAMMREAAREGLALSYCTVENFNEEADKCRPRIKQAIQDTQAEAYKQRVREDVIRECINTALSIPCKWESPIKRPCCATTQAITEALEALIKQQGEG